MTRLFGTDGVRGLANVSLTAELALNLGAAAAQVLTQSVRGTHPVAVVGRDPRRSGEMLEAAIVAGLTSQGVDVELVGVVPTPALAYLTAKRNAELGVMISASHNPMPDNGIKFFAAGGQKLDDAIEDEIEAQMAELQGVGPSGEGVGQVTHTEDRGLSEYVEYVASTVPTRLTGITVVADCANGAASKAAPAAYRAAGAKVIEINSSPDGLNINENSGSTHMEALREAVLELGADLGLAHDGDADRCLAISADGALVDGDGLLAILALAMHEADALPRNTVVATVMSNLGFHNAMKHHGINVRIADVGDRYVLDEMRRGGFGLGGEQSGHIIIPEFATTGDGILTGLHVMEQMASRTKTLAELAAVVTTLPQVLINVRVEDKVAAANSPAVVKATADVAAELGDTGRVLLRPSGTEQVVRVMVEAESKDEAERVATMLAEVVSQN